MTLPLESTSVQIRDRIKELRRVKASELRPNPRNWRTHPQAQQDALRGVLAEIGYADALLARELEDGSLELVDGHLRAETTPDMEVPVLVVDLTEAEAAVVLATLDPMAAMAEAGKQALGELLTSVETGSEALRAMMDGLAAENGIDVFEGGAEEAPEPQIDRAAELQAEWGTKLGQLWEVPGKAGVHRILCGDSTNAEDVGRVMGGKKAALCLTDPPYSVNYDRSQQERGGDPSVHSPYHEGDLDPTSILSFMSLVPSDVMVWTYPIDRHFLKLAAAYKSHGWEMRRELVWVKNTFSFWPSANYQQKHEPIMLAARKGKPVGGNVPANATTVLEYDKPHSHSDHPTAKPGELWGGLLKNHTDSGDMVYDPFLGSGTTLVVCEGLGRIGVGLEIEPAYVAVILERMKGFGLTPCLVETPAG